MQSDCEKITQGIVELQASIIDLNQSLENRNTVKTFRIKGDMEKKTSEIRDFIQVKPFEKLINTVFSTSYMRPDNFKQTTRKNEAGNFEVERINYSEKTKTHFELITESQNYSVVKILNFDDMDEKEFAYFVVSKKSNKIMKIDEGRIESVGPIIEQANGIIVNINYGFGSNVHKGLFVRRELLE